MALALMGIIISLVYPSYGNYLARSRRIEIITVLLRGAANMERYHDNSSGYVNVTQEQVFGNALVNQNYILDIVVATETTFQLTAKLNNNNNLANECAVLTIDQEGNREPIHCWL